MLCSLSWGCPAPTKPHEDARYSTILLGEVVGVRLTDYAAARQKQMRDRARYPLLSDATPGYEVEVLPIELLKGANGNLVGDLVTLRVPSGCAIPRAELSQYGLFKDLTYATRSSCPAGVQELRERMHQSVLGRFDWQMPPLDPSKM
jgi:hypothetical protein